MLLLLPGVGFGGGGAYAEGAALVDVADLVEALERSLVEVQGGGAVEALEVGD